MRAAASISAPAGVRTAIGAARVAGARLAADEALALEAVGQAREAGAAEDDRRREVAHAHAPVRGVVEVQQDLVGAQRQPVGGVEVGVERLGQRRVGAEHAAPGAQLALVELTCSRRAVRWWWPWERRTFVACNDLSSGSRRRATLVVDAQRSDIVAHTTTCRTVSRSASRGGESSAMALEGLHHITAITADAPRNVDFYARVLGLRLVKKTVNFDQPDVYHLYFGDERGTPGSILTFFEFPGARPRPGRRRHGPHHPVARRVRRGARLLGRTPGRRGRRHRAHRRRRAGLRRLRGPAPRAARGRRRRRAAGRPRARHPGRARAAGLPRRARLRLAPRREHRRCWRRSASPTTAARDWTLRGDERHAALRYDAPPARRGVTSAGTVHHVAWSAADDAELEAVRAAGRRRPAPARRRSSTASTSTRSTSASPAACSSSSPAATSASTTTSRWRRSARRSSCRRSTRRRREQLEQRADAADQPARRGRRHDRARPRASARRRASREGALVLMHGRGADEHDLAPFLDLLDPAAAPRRPHARRAAVPAARRAPLVRRAARRLPRPRHLPRLLRAPAARRPASSPACRGSARSSAASRRARSWPTRSGSAPGARRRPGSSP